ncbi:MAG: tRNA lysidine(34) synthetase TilS [bacterium]
MTLKPEEKIQRFLEKYNLLHTENILLVAFSGGIDSLCLLDNLLKLSEKFEFKLIAAHLNHNWRGLESSLEEERAKEYCVARKIEFYSETLAETLPHTEIEARKQRYNFLNKIAIKVNASGIFTGHTLTDQVETVLYRIIKGTGTIGLKGIPEVRYQNNFPAIFRPMLEITRDETLKYCENNNLTPNVDTSNFKQEFLRNRIRLSLIPELKTYNSNVEKAVLRLSVISEEAEQLINCYLKEVKDKIFINNDEISTKEFLNMPAPAQKRVLLDFLIYNKIEYNYERIERILNFVEESSGLKSGNTLSIAKDCWLFVSSQIIKIIHSIKAETTKTSVLIKLDKEIYHPDFDKIIKIIPWQGEIPEKYPKESSNIIYVDLDKLNKPIYFRSRQIGDKIQPFGMKQKMKFKKYLINKGIPEHERDNLPLLAMNSEILWAVGVGISELLRVKDIPTHLIQVY